MLVLKGLVGLHRTVQLQLLQVITEMQIKLIKRKTILQYVFKKTIINISEIWSHWDSQMFVDGTVKWCKLIAEQ